MSEVIRNVNPQEMINTATTLEGKIEEWNNAVTEIYALKDELDFMWDGAANDTFNAQWQEDRGKYNMLTQVMTEYCAAIKSAANKYIEAENQVINTINSAN